MKKVFCACLMGLFLVGCVTTADFDEKVSALEKRMLGAECLISGVDFVSQMNDCMLMGGICMANKGGKSQCQAMVEECSIQAYQQFQQIQKSRGCNKGD